MANLYAVVTFFDRCRLLLPPKLQRRGLVFEGKMVTMERVMGYYGTCMQVTMIVHERLLWMVCDGLLWSMDNGLL